MSDVTQQQIRYLTDMNYVKTAGFGKCGRPIVWFIMRNFKPEGINREMTMNFMCYFLDYVNSIMKPNVDIFFMVVDMQDAGYANMSVELFKSTAELSGVSFLFYNYRFYTLKDWEDYLF